jgi:hypothetical protein
MNVQVRLLIGLSTHTFFYAPIAARLRLCGQILREFLNSLLGDECYPASTYDALFSSRIWRRSSK